MDLPLVLAQPREAVLAEMRAVVGDRTLPIYGMARYALGWVEADGAPRTEAAGKGIRPALAVLAGQALDPSDAARRRALAGAAAIEFVHNFSLVHDDIQDRDDERHHRPPSGGCGARRRRSTPAMRCGSWGRWRSRGPARPAPTRRRCWPRAKR